MATFLAFLSCLLFALGDIFVRKLGHSIGTWELVFIINAFFMMTNLGVVAKGKLPWWPTQHWKGLGMALCRVGATVFAIMALRELEVSFYYLILYLFPLWMMIMGSALLRERPRKTQVWGAILALIGIGVVYYRGGIPQGIGVIYTLLCSLCLATQLIINRSMKREPTFSIGLANAIVALGVAGGVMIWQGGFHSEGVFMEHLPLILTIVVFFVGAPLASIYAAKRLRSYVYGLIAYIQVPMALLGAWILLGENMSESTAIGIALVVLGSLTSQMPEKKKKVLQEA